MRNPFFFGVVFAVSVLFSGSFLSAQTPKRVHVDDTFELPLAPSEKLLLVPDGVSSVKTESGYTIRFLRLSLTPLEITVEDSALGTHKTWRFVVFPLPFSKGGTWKGATETRVRIRDVNRELLLYDSNDTGAQGDTLLSRRRYRNILLDVGTFSKQETVYFIRLEVLDHVLEWRKGDSTFDEGFQISLRNVLFSGTSASFTVRVLTSAGEEVQRISLPIRGRRGQEAKYSMIPWGKNTVRVTFEVFEKTKGLLVFYNTEGVQSEYPFTMKPKKKTKIMTYHPRKKDKGQVFTVKMFVGGPNNTVKVAETKLKME